MGLRWVGGISLGIAAFDEKGLQSGLQRNVGAQVDCNPAEELAIPSNQIGPTPVQAAQSIRGGVRGDEQAMKRHLENCLHDSDLYLNYVEKRGETQAQFAEAFLSSTLDTVQNPFPFLAHISSVTLPW